MPNVRITDLPAITNASKEDKILIQNTEAGTTNTISTLYLAQSMGFSAVTGFSARVSQNDDSIIIVNPTNGGFITGYVDDMKVSFKAPVKNTDKQMKIQISDLAPISFYEINTDIAASFEQKDYIEAVYYEDDGCFYYVNNTKNIKYVYINDYVLDTTKGTNNSGYELDPDGNYTYIYLKTAAEGDAKTRYYDGMSAIFDSPIATKGTIYISLDGLALIQLENNPTISPITWDLYEGQTILARYNTNRDTFFMNQFERTNQNFEQSKEYIEKEIERESNIVPQEQEDIANVPEARDIFVTAPADMQKRFPGGFVSIAPTPSNKGIFTRVEYIGDANDNFQNLEDLLLQYTNNYEEGQQIAVIIRQSVLSDNTKIRQIFCSAKQINILKPYLHTITVFTEGNQPLNFNITNGHLLCSLFQNNEKVWMCSFIFNFPINIIGTRTIQKSENPNTIPLINQNNFIVSYNILFGINAHINATGATLKYDSGVVTRVIPIMLGSLQNHRGCIFLSNGSVKNMFLGLIYANGFTYIFDRTDITEVELGYNYGGAFNYLLNLVPKYVLYIQPENFNGNNIEKSVPCVVKNSTFTISDFIAGGAASSGKKVIAINSNFELDTEIPFSDVFLQNVTLSYPNSQYYQGFVADSKVHVYAESCTFGNNTGVNANNADMSVNGNKDTLIELYNFNGTTNIAPGTTTNIGTITVYPSQ